LQDLFSYRKERLANDCDYNAITCVMYHLGLDLHGAVRWVSERHEATLQKFLQTREKVISHDGYPSYGADLDTQIAQYTGVLADWIRGNYEWSWYSKR
jgi:Delta6-protoilludene synthase